jgi:hypothetical protein
MPDEPRTMSASERAGNRAPARHLARNDVPEGLAPDRDQLAQLAGAAAPPLPGANSGRPRHQHQQRWKRAPGVERDRVVEDVTPREQQRAVRFGLSRSPGPRAGPRARHARSVAVPSGACHPLGAGFYTSRGCAERMLDCHRDGRLPQIRAARAADYDAASGAARSGAWRSRDASAIQLIATVGGLLLVAEARSAASSASATASPAGATGRHTCTPSSRCGRAGAARASGCV